MAARKVKPIAETEVPVESEVPIADADLIETDEPIADAEPIVTEVPIADARPFETEVPIAGADAIDPEVPSEIPFIALACAMTALARINDERRGYVASKIGDRTVRLSMPQPGGGHRRFKLTLPDSIPVDLEPLE